MSLRPPQGYAEPTHRLPEQATTPVVMADGGTVYTRDYAGISELCYEDSAGNVVKLTSGGAIVGPTPGGSADDIQINDGAGGFGAPGAAVLASGQIDAAAGTALLPGVVGDGDINTGVAWLAGDEMSLCAGGAVKAEITAAGVGVIDGVEAAPSIHFAGDPDTGIWHSGANQLAVSVAGSYATLWLTGAFPRQILKGTLDMGPSLGGQGDIWWDSVKDTGLGTGLKLMPWNGSHQVERGLHIGYDHITVGGPIGVTLNTGYSTRVARIQSTNSTPINVTTDTLLDNYTYLFEADVIGRDEAGTDRCSYKFVWQAHRQSAGVATLGTITTLYSSETDAALDATAVVSGSDVHIQVTGKAGVDIVWLAVTKVFGVSTN